MENSIDPVVATGGMSILAAACRSALSENKRSLPDFLRGLVMAVFVGIIVGQLVKDYQLHPAVQSAIVGIASFIADDILLFILMVSTAIRKNPKEAILNLIDYVFRG